MSQKIFAASQPALAPVQTDLSAISQEYAALSHLLGKPTPDGHTRAIDLPGADHLFFVTPIANAESTLGTLIIACKKGVFLPRFYGLALHALIPFALVLCVLLPIHWYWARRIAAPLVQLTHSVQRLGRQPPTDVAAPRYAYHDELGQLFDAFGTMVGELREKHELEHKMIQSERMAALGQLSAGVAHEINNPLGGMLMAIDTLKCHHNVDPRMSKTIDMIERGLTQIKETVGALLVEARVRSRRLAAHDIDDVLLLLSPQARKASVHIEWSNRIAADVDLPASMVRQVLINLMLNAIQASNPQQTIDATTEIIDATFHFSVSNVGRLLSDQQIEHLFEPFTPVSDTGNGLGLWVTYQIVQQLQGQIVARREAERMCFSVSLPLGDVA